MKKEEYIASPSRASSLPFWKSGVFSLPRGWKIVREDEFDEKEYAAFEDDPYFRLVHRLEKVKKPALPSLFSMKDASLEDFVSHIEECYGGEMDAQVLKTYLNHPTYDPSLWIAISDASGKIIGSLIGELDSSIREGIIEWVQVSKSFRKKGLASYLIQEFLYRMKQKADFVTVSGRLYNSSRPEALYKACGFKEETIWHILRPIEIFKKGG